jgi:hypothetical protein
MKPPPHPRVSVVSDDGTVVTASAPLVISASRATDIPAFFAEWFMARLDKGFSRRVNPFNGRPSFVSFENCRIIVFWSKDPSPLLPHLDEIDRRGFRYLFQLTVNDYEPDGFEPGLPPLDRRIDTVFELAERIGRERILWRFDPLILTRSIGAEVLLEKIARIGDRISPAVSRLTISFLSPYRSVLRRMQLRGIRPIEPSIEAIARIGSGLSALGKKWGIEIVTCAESADMRSWDILPGSCIDPLYLAKLFPGEPALRRLIDAAGDRDLFENGSEIRRRLKDAGQRPLCNCMISKDIGAYGTCSHGCVYCYAQNRSP